MRRLIFRLFLFLLLGAIVNVVVALGSSLSLSSAAREARESQQRRWEWRDDDSGRSWQKGMYITKWTFSQSVVSLWIDRTLFSPSHQTQAETDGLSSTAISDQMGITPSWAKVVLTEPGETTKVRLIWAEAHGWPSVSLHGCKIEDDAHGHVVGIDLSRSDSLVPKLLPTIPVWPGFAIDTLFYGIVAWLLFAAPSALRRRLRAFRSLCLHCAYPIGTNAVCTECGHPVARP